MDNYPVEFSFPVNYFSDMVVDGMLCSLFLQRHVPGIIADAVGFSVSLWCVELIKHYIVHLLRTLYSIQACATGPKDGTIKVYL